MYENWTWRFRDSLTRGKILHCYYSSIATMSLLFQQRKGKRPLEVEKSRELVPRGFIRVK